MLGDILSTVSSLFGLGYNIAAGQLARRDQRYYYEQSLPENLKRHRLIAGLNPYNEGAQLSVPNPVNIADGVNEGVSNLNNAYQSYENRKISKKLADIQDKKLTNDSLRLDLERDRLQKDLDLADAQISNLNATRENTIAKTAYQLIENEVNEKIKDNRINISKAELDEHLLNLQSLFTNNAFLPLILYYSVAKSDAEISKIASDIGLNKKQVELLEEQIQNAKFDNAAIDALDEIVPPDEDSFGSKLIRGFVRILKYFKSK